MFAVIFRATLKPDASNYLETAGRLRALAEKKYGCREFTAVSEGKDEIAISYWDDEAQILAWRNDPEHRAAQQRGREEWYAAYQVQVVEVLRAYHHSAD